MDYKLPVTARKFVLFQRNLLLPEQPKPTGLQKLLARIGLYDDSFETFVENYAKAEPELIEAKYFELMRDTAADLLPHIPKTTQSILDIGCGIAGVDLFFYHALQSPKLYLLDKTQLEEKVWYMFEEVPAFYNSLDIGRDTLELNGVASQDIETIEAPDDGVIPLEPKSVDFIVSTVSWGFMYPIKPYLESVVNLLSDDGVVLTDIRKGTDGKALLAQHFDTEIIREQRKFETLKCRRKA